MTFSGEFFSFKSALIFAFRCMLFNLVVKHFPVFFGWFALCFWEKQGQNIEACTVNATRYNRRKIFYVFLLLLFFFKKKDQVKKMQGNVLLLNWNAHARIQAFLKGKKFTQKSHLHQSCTKSFILVPTTTQLRRHSWLQQCWGCLLTENVSETPVEF